MWSKRIGVLSVLAVLVFSAAAFAAVQDFKDFTVDVPDDWTATQNGTTVGIVANDNSAAVSITVDKRDGMEAKDLAAAFAEKLKGSEPVLEDDVYHFDFKNEAGVESRAILNTEGDNYLLLVITGQNPKLEALIDSIQGK
ncbi:MAG: hypothetical protein ACFNW0_06855 [Fretibacterium sp.]